MRAALLAPATWSADPRRSRVGFAVERRPAGTLRGHVGDVAADLRLGPDGEAVLAGSAGTGSVVVPGAPAARDALAAALDAGRFPRLTFASSAVELAGDRLQVDGLLTVRDTTLLVTAAGQLVGEDAGAALRLTLETVVDLRQFGVAPAWAEPAGMAVGHETRLHADLVLRRRQVP